MTISEVITELKTKSDTLRGEVPVILTYTSVDDVTMEMIKRDEYRNEISKVQNSLSDKIAEMEAMKRNLGDMKREHKTDIDKIENYKFQLLYSRRQANA